MPELPEVQTVCKALKKNVVGKKITNILVKEAKLIKNTNQDFFTNSIENQKITNIRRIGKYILIDLEKNTIVSHLRMEGKYFFYQEKPLYTKHDYIIFTFEDHSELVYNDTRKFGTLELTEFKKEQTLKSISKLGHEPGAPNLTLDYLKAKAQNKKSHIKVFLLDQTVITGLGNIYVDELLFICEIHPLTRVNKITDSEFGEIISNADKLMQQAIKNGGTTVKSYKFSIDQIGGNQDFLMMYGKKDEPCVKCDTKIIKIKVGGRGTCFCPHCQKEVK